MIKPTPGRVVHFYPAIGEGRNTDGTPLAALVAFVTDDRTVNLTVSHADGYTYGLTNVKLVQDGDAFDPDGAHAEWMPYQKGQAAKTEAVEAAAAPDLSPVHSRIAELEAAITSAVQALHDRIAAFEAPAKTEAPQQGEQQPQPA